MLPWIGELAGRLDEQVITSELLRGNALGDPFERPVYVYLPPGYDDEPGRRYPVIYIIMGYTGHIAMWRNRTPFRQIAMAGLGPGQDGARARRSGQVAALDLDRRGQR